MLEVRKIARELGQSTVEVALKWALSNPGISCVLAGARSRQQLEANAAIVAEPLPAEVMQRLGMVTDILKNKLGSGFDYFESNTNDRTR